MTQTILVTGANGFIARHIVLRLLQSGYRVRASLRDTARAGDLADALRPQLADLSVLGPDRLETVALDLEADTGWSGALSGVAALMHTASPFPMTPPSDPDAVIRPAVAGTLRALRAAAQAGVGRVVLTSSAVAIAGTVRRDTAEPLGPQDWADPDLPGATAYGRSKLLAERAAWDFVARDAPDMALTTINPALVLGPPLGRRWGTSLRLVERLLSGRDPMLPQIGFPVVDVRDVAEAHLRALQRPETAGQRIPMGEDFLWMAEMAAILKDSHPGRRITTRVAPAALLRLLALFDPALRGILPSLGWRWTVSDAPAQRLLDLTPRPAREAVLAAAAAVMAGRQGSG